MWGVAEKSVAQRCRARCNSEVIRTKEVGAQGQEVDVPRHADARPGSSRAAGPVLKLHRRVVRLGGHDHTLLTLRPVAQVRFSTNFFHGTWHILSDGHGAQVLARLLWGLSYQARPGTIVLLDEANLDPNPFDAE